MCVCVDLAQQTAEAGDLLLQVSGLDNQLVADSLGLLFGVQREDQLQRSSETQRPRRSLEDEPDETDSASALIIR